MMMRFVALLALMMSANALQAPLMMAGRGEPSRYVLKHQLMWVSHWYCCRRVSNAASYW